MKRILLLAVVFLSVSSVTHGQKVDFHFVDEAIKELDTAAYHAWMLRFIREEGLWDYCSAKQRRRVIRMYKEAVKKYVPFFIPVVWLDWEHYVKTGDVVFYPTSHKTPYCPFVYATGGLHAWLPRVRFSMMRSPLFKSLDYPFDVYFFDGDSAVLGINRAHLEGWLGFSSVDGKGLDGCGGGFTLPKFLLNKDGHTLECHNLNESNYIDFFYEENGQAYRATDFIPGRGYERGELLLDYLREHADQIQHNIDNAAESKALFPW